MKRDSEAAFQQQVLQLAAFYGWRSYHTHDSRRSQPGFPDLVLVRGPDLIFAELKTDKGRIRPEQHEWLDALGAVGNAISDLALEAYGATRLEGFGPPLPALPSVHAFVWRPRDFDVLHAVLARGRHRVEPIYRSEAA